jgi:hypothetical protein
MKKLIVISVINEHGEEEMKKFTTFFLSLMIMTGFTGCPTVSGSSGNSSSTSSSSSGGTTAINISGITGIAPPFYTANPVTTITGTSQYTGTVTWNPSDSTFAATTVYTATINLTAKSGYTLTGVTANFFTVAGATSVSNSADSGVITAVFPATASPVSIAFQSAVQTGGASGTADSTALTLTFDKDPTTLTAGNITVTGATKGALSGSGTTRTLAISGITSDDGAGVSITITSPSGYTISGSPKTAVIYRLLSIGMAYQGGNIAYILQSGDPGYVSGQTHGLIAAKSDQSTGIQWYNGSYVATGATGTALGTGQANTTKIISKQGAGSYAAKLCDDYVNADTGTGVYSDWYLPSRDELTKLYLLKSVIGGFPGYIYWSSSEDSVNYALVRCFTIDYQYSDLKSYSTFTVRAVRSF